MAAVYIAYEIKTFGILITTTNASNLTYVLAIHCFKHLVNILGLSDKRIDFPLKTGCNYIISFRVT
jgi:hypothetical protein